MVNHHLKTFIAAADSGSFIKAGEKLFISPNAVTKQINLLEQHLQVKLFVRNHRGLALTPEGEYIYNEAAALIRRSEEVLNHVHLMNRSGSGVIRVGTSLMNAYHILHERWMRIADQAPDMLLQIEPYRDDINVFEDILGHLGESIDVIPCLYDDFYYQGRCRILHLMDQPVRIGVPGQHHLAGKRQLDWEDLAGETIIMSHSAANPVLTRIRRDLIRHCPGVVIEEAGVIDYHVFNRAVSENKLLITVDCWRDTHPLMRTLPMNWSYTYPYGLIYPLKASPLILRFVDLLKESM